MLPIRKLRIAPTFLLVSLLLPAQPVSKTRIAEAVAAWAAATSDSERISVRQRLGPFDTAIFTAAGNEGEELQKKGDFAGALNHDRFCSDAAQAAGDDMHSSLCLQLAAVVERLQGKYAESEADYLRALEFARRPGVTARIPLVMSNLAGVYVAQSRYPEALAILREVLEINKREGVTNDAAPFQNIAVIYAMEGDLARSLDNFLIALHMYEQQKNDRKIALTHFNLGVLQLKQTNYEAAARELETALAMSEKVGDKMQTAHALSDLGWLRHLQNRPDEALKAITQAISIFQEIGSKSGYEQARINLGNFYLEHDRYSDATREFEAARKLIEQELHDGYDLGLALRGLGLVARKQSDFTLSLSYAGKAVEEARGIGDLQGEWQAEALAGLASEGLGNVPESRAAFERSIALIERQRGMIGGGEVEKQRFFEQATYPYRELAGLAIREGNPLGALQAAERARSRVLLDILAAGPAPIDRLMTEEERHAETRLRGAMSAINARIARTPAPELPAVQARADAAWHEYETFLAALYVRHPELRTWRGESPPLAETDLAALVKTPGTAILEYLCGEEESFLFAITDDESAEGVHIEAYRIAQGRRQLATRTERFRIALEGRDPGFRLEARALYDLLVEPAKASLRGVNRIALVADGPLWELPFQTLMSPSGRYWIEDAAIVWAPSISFLRDHHGTRRPAVAYSRDLLALGDPARAETSSIPALAQQARRIGSLYESSRSQVLTGADANEQAFKHNAPGARVLHLAAHGVVDTQNALHSRILLAPSGSQETPEDGWLEAWEVMRMNLPAELAVLSACETGRGKVSDGEGLMGLTWALFVAGVQGAVVSQWRVETESTTRLMVGLHERLRGGLAPPEALRGSVLALMKDARYRHPMYWGGFIAVSP